MTTDAPVSAKEQAGPSQRMVARGPLLCAANYLARLTAGEMTAGRLPMPGDMVTLFPDGADRYLTRKSMALSSHGLPTDA